ncbi:hypothetical protein [Streptomyces sp. NBC_00285]|uniref:hypothetical protein n=1 Tax=Streptomyces sp. NBC_00285 TaxID=2975700 RepID=UPI002E2A5AFB|nr:hypothetical protein [Streptomyces sp. NBC_00285]
MQSDRRGARSNVVDHLEALLRGEGHAGLPDLDGPLGDLFKPLEPGRVPPRRRGGTRPGCGCRAGWWCSVRTTTPAQDATWLAE